MMRDTEPREARRTGKRPSTSSSGQCSRTARGSKARWIPLGRVPQGSGRAVLDLHRDLIGLLDKIEGGDPISQRPMIGTRRWTRPVGSASSSPVMYPHRTAVVPRDGQNRMFGVPGAAYWRRW